MHCFFMVHAFKRFSFLTRATWNRTIYLPRIAGGVLPILYTIPLISATLIPVCTDHHQVVHVAHFSWLYTHYPVKYHKYFLLVLRYLPNLIVLFQHRMPRLFKGRMKMLLVPLMGFEPTRL